MSRILIWSPNYAPELTGIPPLVTDAAEWLSRHGHNVEVIAPVPNYPEREIDSRYRGIVWCSERRGDVLIHRSWLRVRPEERFLDKALYELTASTVSLPHVLRRLGRFDVLICVIPTLSAAFYSAVLTRALRAVGGSVRLVLWVQDLVLAAAASVTGMGVRSKRVLEALAPVEKAAAVWADAVVVCSPGFRDRLVERGVDQRKIVILLNWADLEAIEFAPALPHDGPTRFLYAGNLGYTQRFETLFDALRIANTSMAVEIVGAGNASGHVDRLARTFSNVEVSPPVTRDEYPALLARADVHLVLQRRISAGANLPSKISSYMASGRPIIASIDQTTPAAELLRASGGAVLVEPESPRELAEAMLTLADAPKLRDKLGRSGRAFAERRLSREAALSRFEAAVLG